MNMKTGLFGLGLLVAAGALTISCGGGDDGGDDNSKAGTSNNASGNGSGGTGTGGSSTAGTNSSGGTNNNAGTTSTAGTSNNGGTNSNGGTNNNGSAGDDNGPGEGGADGGEACPATAPEDGTECDRAGGFQNACPYDTTVCSCQGRQNREWNCQPIGGGEGGAGPGQVECPATEPADGADCTGFGFCQFEDNNCACDGEEWNCF
jgi:hypothetical protein